MRSICLTLAVFLFIATEINACSSNANSNEQDRGNQDREDRNRFEISGSIQKAKEEYDIPTKVTIQWINILKKNVSFNKSLL